MHRIEIICKNCNCYTERTAKDGADFFQQLKNEGLKVSSKNTEVLCPICGSRNTKLHTLD